MSEEPKTTQRPKTAAEVFKIILDDAAKQLSQGGVASHPQDGGIGFQQNGVSFVLFGNQVMRGQKGTDVSWFVPEPNSKGGAPLREIENPPALVGEEILKAIRHQQLVSGSPMPAAGWYLVSFFNYGDASSKLERSILIDSKKGKASVSSAQETEQFLAKVNSQLMSQIIQQNHQQQQWMLNQNARNNEMLLNAKGAMGASYNPWKP